MSEQPSSEKWTLLRVKRPPKYGEYRIKNARMEGYGHFGADGWAVFGDWEGNIVSWAEKPECH